MGSCGTMPRRWYEMGSQFLSDTHSWHGNWLLMVCSTIINARNRPHTQGAVSDCWVSRHWEKMVSVGLDTLKPKQNHHPLQTILWNAFSGQNLIVLWFKFHRHLLSGVQFTTRYYWFRWCLGAKQHIRRLSQIWPILLKLICTTRPQWVNFRSVARLCDPVSLSYIVWSAKTCSKLFISDILW